MRADWPVVAFVGVAVLSWFGCGGSGVCDKAEQASQHLANAMSTCPAFGGSGDGGVPVFTISYNKAACQNALSKCSAADQQALSKTFDCFSNMSRCTPGQENQFIGGVIACGMMAGDVSQACQAGYAQ